MNKIIPIDVSSSREYYGLNNSSDIYKGTSFRFAGSWSPNTRYFNDEYIIDFISSDGALWACQRSHISGISTLDSPKKDQPNSFWTLVIEGIEGKAYMPVWDSEGNLTFTQTDNPTDISLNIQSLRGESAYDIAKKLNPNIGSQEEWIESLNGSDGQDGVTYKPTSIDENYIWFTASNGETVNFPVEHIKGAKGDPGEPGQPGQPGRNGEDGKSVSINHNVNVITLTPTEAATAHWEVSENNNNIYTLNLRIPKGQTGAKGNDGARGPQGNPGKNAPIPQFRIEYITTETDDCKSVTPHLKVSVDNGTSWVDVGSIGGKSPKLMRVFGDASDPESQDETILNDRIVWGYDGVDVSEWTTLCYLDDLRGVGIDQIEITDDAHLKITYTDGSVHITDEKICSTPSINEIFITDFDTDSRVENIGTIKDPIWDFYLPRIPNLKLVVLDSFDNLGDPTEDKLYQMYLTPTTESSEYNKYDEWIVVKINDEYSWEKVGSLQNIEHELTGDDTKIPTSKAVMDYVVSKLKSVLNFKGTIGDSGTISELPTVKVKTGDAYIVISAGNYGDQYCEPGDIIIATSSTPTWTVLQNNLNVATSSTLGTIKVGFTSDEVNKNYKVELDANSNAFVHVNWENTEYTFSDGDDGSFTVNGQKVSIGKPTISGTADKVQNTLSIKVNSGSTENTDKYTFDGTDNKELDIVSGDNITLVSEENKVIVSSTDESVSSVENHYIPENGEIITSENIENIIEGDSIISGIKIDNAGHITEVVSKKMVGANSEDLINIESKLNTLTWYNSEREELGIIPTAPQDIIDQYSYGVEWEYDQLDPTLTRVGNMEMHRTLPIHSKLKGCVCNEHTLNYYLDENNWAYKADGSPSDLSGADGTVRVHIPKFYGKSGKTGNKYWVRISETKIDVTWFEIPEMYLDAYLAMAVETKDDVQRVNRKSIIPSNDWLRKDLSSYSSTGVFFGDPNIGMGGANFKSYFWPDDGTKYNYDYLDPIWGMWILYWLPVIEYATFNIALGEFNSELNENGFHQGGLQQWYGYKDENDQSFKWGNVEQYIPTGIGNHIGNGTGMTTVSLQQYKGFPNSSRDPLQIDPDGITIEFQVPRWRGFDNHLGINGTIFNFRVYEPLCTNVWHNPTPVINIPYIGYITNGVPMFNNSVGIISNLNNKRINSNGEEETLKTSTDTGLCMNLSSNMFGSGFGGAPFGVFCCSLEGNMCTTVALGFGSSGGYAPFGVRTYNFPNKPFITE